MKIKDGFLLKEVAGNHVVLPVGKMDFDGVITLNETGVFIWKQLENSTTREKILSAFLDVYEVSEEKAREDLDAFLQILIKADLIDEHA